MIDERELERDGKAGRGRPGRRWLWMALLVVATVGLAAVLGVGFGRDPSVVESELPGEPAPDLSGETLAGEPFDLAEHRGEVLVVNFWASWCPPCREEIPVLVAAQERLGDRGLQVVGVNSQDSDADASEFVDEVGGTSFPHVVDHEGGHAVDWGVFGLPETYVVDRDGVVRAKVTGVLGPDWIQQEVVPLLEEGS